MRLIHLAIMLVVAHCLPALAQEPVDLRWKFEVNKPFYMSMTTSTHQRITVMNKEIDQGQKQTFYFQWKPLKFDPATRNWLISHRIMGVQMQIDISGNKVEIDSSKPGSAERPLGKFFKALMDNEMLVTVDRDFKVIKIEGRDKILRSLGEARPDLKELLDKILNEDSFRELATPVAFVIPDRPVKVGDVWKRTSILNIGPIGSYENTYVCTFKGKDSKEQNLDRIAVRPSVKYKAPKANEIGKLPFKIRGADLRSTRSEGTVLFDRNKGRVHNAYMKLDVLGTLELEIGGKETEVDLQQTQETRLEFSDRPFVPPPAPK